MTRATTIHGHLDAMVAKVREFAALKPHHVDDSSDCSYYFHYVKQPDGDSIEFPPCIVGCAAWDLGYIDPYDEQEIIGTIDYKIMFEFTTNTAFLDEHELSDNYWDPRLKWLAEVQRGQDHGATWRDAVVAADQMFPGVA